MPIKIRVTEHAGVPAKGAGTVAVPHDPHIQPSTAPTPPSAGKIWYHTQLDHPMETLKRFPENPVIRPDPKNDWEAVGAYNPSVATDGTSLHLVYRALSHDTDLHGARLQVSSVGYAKGKDPLHFETHEQIIRPEESWERFGCEDPRVTYFEGTYYIFYTALSTFPFSADGIKAAVAITKDFKTFEKHLVTPFNAKAMMLFPDRVQGKMAALLTVNTDRPPAKIALALFDHESDMWSPAYWENWYASLDEHIVPLLRSSNDHVEGGAAPLKTKDGWLLFYSYIPNYRAGRGKFTVEAALLDMHDPRRVFSFSQPLLAPEKEYELRGIVPNIVFPSGARVVSGTKVLLYYGAADTVGAVAGIDLEPLLAHLRPVPAPEPPHGTEKNELLRFDGNPILAPRAEFAWEAKAVFNPAAIYEDGAFHILYRAMSDDNTSTIGYAMSRDGFHIDERLTVPIYTPREPFEEKRVPGGNSGCEDPRLTKIGDTLYMHYTAYNGVEPPRVAMTSISIGDFLARRWNWEKPVIISPPNFDDKDACILPKKLEGKYLVFHRLGTNICIDAVPSLVFPENRWLEGMTLFGPRDEKWDNVKIGIAAPPIETPAGWLLFYHGVSEPGNIYKVGAALLARDNPVEVIARSEYPLLTPEMKYEREGQVSNVVFPCGVAERNGTLFVYYGGADRVVGVATADLMGLVESLQKT